MALSERILGPDGDQTVADEKEPQREVMPGDHVLYQYYRTKRTGVISGREHHEPGSAYVIWDDNGCIGSVSKVHLIIIK